MLFSTAFTNMCSVAYHLEGMLDMQCFEDVKIAKTLTARTTDDAIWYNINSLAREMGMDIPSGERDQKDLHSVCWEYVVI